MGIAGQAGADNEVTRAHVIRAGRRAFLREERIDVVAIAGQLGIARATVYRWFGNRDQFISQVMASLALDTLEGCLRRLSVTGPDLVVGAMVDMVNAVMAHPAMKTFIAADPRRALVILTGPDSAVHAELTRRTTALIAEHCPDAAGEGLTDEDVAYAMVRMAEAFCYTHVTTGRPSEIDRARPLLLRILGGTDL